MLCCRMQTHEWLLGGAALVILAGIAKSAWQQPRRETRALPATSSAESNGESLTQPPAVSPHSEATPPAATPAAAPGDHPKAENWWDQREVFIVADQGDPRNPETAGPILFQAAGRALLPSFQVCLHRLRSPSAASPLHATSALVVPVVPVTGGNPFTPRGRPCRTRRQPRRLPRRSGRGTVRVTARLATARRHTPANSTSPC